MKNITVANLVSYCFNQKLCQGIKHRVNNTITHSVLKLPVMEIAEGRDEEKPLIPFKSLVIDML